MSLLRRIDNFFSIRNDFFHFVSKLTRERFINFVKVFLAHNFGFISENIKPINVLVETTHGCNFNCVMCKAGEKSKTFMSFENFKKVADMFSRETIFLYPYVEGEPFLNKSIYDMLSYASQKNFFVNVSSNFSVINPHRILMSGIDEISASLDSCKKETFEKIRLWADFDRVISNIKRFAELKREKGLVKPELSITATLMKENENETEDILNFALSLGIRKVYFQIVLQRNDAIKKSTYLPSKGSIKKVKELKKIYRRKGIKVYLISYHDFERGDGFSKYCFWAYLSMLVGANGDAYPCCIVFGEKEHSFGNIFDDFDGVMRRRFEFVKNFRRKKPEFCEGCPLYHRSPPIT